MRKRLPSPRAAEEADAISKRTETADEFVAIVGLRCQVAQIHSLAIQVLLNSSGKNGAAAAGCLWAKAQTSTSLRTSQAVYSSNSRRSLWVCGQNCGISHRSLVSVDICWTKL
jgi:phosphoribosyl-AMP cyclohydrolase